MEEQLAALFSNNSTLPENQRLFSLMQFQDQIENITPDQRGPLIQLVLPLCKQLITNNSISLRKWLLEFIRRMLLDWDLDDHILKIILPDCVEPILISIASNDEVGFKSAIQCLSCVYSTIFRLICTDTLLLKKCWDAIQEIKKAIATKYRPGTLGLGVSVRIAIISFWKTIAITQSSSDPLVDVCEARHPFFNNIELNSEAAQIVEKLFSLMPLETEVVITASINALTILCRVRPQYSNTIIPSLIRFVRAPPPRHLATMTERPQLQLKWRSIERTVKNVLMVLLRHPCSIQFTHQMNDSLVYLGAKPNDFAIRVRQRDALQAETKPSSKRAAIDSGSTVKRMKSENGFSSSFITPKLAVAMDVSIFPPATAVEIVLHTLRNVSESQWSDGLKVFSSFLGLPQPLQMNISTQPSMHLHHPISRDPRLRDPRLVKKEQTPEPVMESIQPPVVPQFEQQIIQAQAILKQKQLQPDTAAPDEKADLEVPIFDGPIEPIVLDELPDLVSRREILKCTFERMLQLEELVSFESEGKTSLIGGNKVLVGAAKVGWMILISRFLNRTTMEIDETNEHLEGNEVVLEKEFCRRMMFDFILEDFKQRQELAVQWLHEEFHQEIKHSGTSYNIWFHKILEKLADVLDPKDRSFTKFLVDVPRITSWSINTIVREYCEDPERMQLGISTLRDLINLRPSVRQECLDILLRFCLHPAKTTRSNSIVTAKRWITSEHPSLAHKIESVALSSMKMIKNLPKSQLLEDIDTEDSKRLQDDEIIRHIELFLATCSRKPELLLELFEEYTILSDDIQRTIRTVIHPLIKSLLGNTEALTKLHSLLLNFPSGSESLALRLLMIMVEKQWPSEELVGVVRQVVDKRKVDVRFLVPVLCAMEKTEILGHLPRIVSLLDGGERQRRVVRDIFLRLLQVDVSVEEDSTVENEKNSEPNMIDRKPPITPVELLVALHGMEESVGLKRQMEATDICIKSLPQYDAEVVAVVLQQLTNATKPATLLMRTVIQSVTRHNSLSGFINSIILPRMITKRVWTNNKLWPGWIKCAEVTSPGSISVVLGLPKEQCVEVLRRSEELRERVRDLADKGNQPARKMLDLIN